MTGNKRKLAIVDLDGTLYDTKQLNYQAYKKAALSLGLEFDLTVQQFSDKCFGRSYKNFLPEILKYDELYIEKIHNLKVQYYPSMLQYAVENTALIDILFGLRQTYYLALVTTASKKNVQDILAYFGRLELFDMVITGNDVQLQKPAPEGYLKAMDKFNILPENTILFEDNDACIKTAKELKMTVFKIIDM